MNYIDKIFDRADIQQICEFLLYGVESDIIDPRSYKERAETTQRQVIARLQEAYPDEKEYEEIIGLVYDCVSDVESVFMEIGLQLGAKITAQVCRNLKTVADTEE